MLTGALPVDTLAHALRMVRLVTKTRTVCVLGAAAATVPRRDASMVGLAIRQIIRCPLPAVVVEQPRLLLRNVGDMRIRRVLAEWVAGSARRRRRLRRSASAWGKLEWPQRVLSDAVLDVGAREPRAQSALIRELIKPSLHPCGECHDPSATQSGTKRGGTGCS